ncbi:MAG: hypothetical protein GY731_09985 [Gammaproteobacteria bacterium]|nr:hypothetical protein [Gammaproteobacteria bacterium]
MAKRHCSTPVTGITPRTVFYRQALRGEKGNEKGRVESGVGYVKKNLLNGLVNCDFSILNPAARDWLTHTANVRIHGETHKRPVDLFQEEQELLHRLPAMPYDLGR